MPDAGSDLNRFAQFALFALLASASTGAHAQVRDAQVYYDAQGNRVIVDAVTGEVVSIEPAEPPQPRYQRERRPRQWQDDSVYDDPELEQYERRRYERAYPDDGYRQYPDELYPDEQQAPRQQPRVVERTPLPEPSEPKAIQQAPANSGDSVIDLGKAPATNPTIQSAIKEDVAGLQVLLDRVGASPGVIDGRFGSNVDRALENYRALTGQPLKSTDTIKIKEQLSATGGDAIIDYMITAEDAAGPFVASVPEDYSEKAKLDRLGYTSVPEMLAERFHMDEKFLRSLNPDANFNRAGTIIRVTNIGKNVTKPVARIIADKGNKQVRAYGEDGKLVVAYPATIGSAETPSPTGTHTISRVVTDPGYTYNPKVNFKQGQNDKVLNIPPGPNGPVGNVWIALDKPTYGVHGTPEPSKIGKTESHGCVRLTNWDAMELAKLVKPGVTVEFVE
ncbi:L,D-transpeptidase [Mesorhizobium denitrificans]|uniref:L,D-transpeptidase n=1 Tax=Mesorhizobium denitrificans TaxID=2294114 RepID=A0A371XFG3_9HYPH|nr:L,D-transpeptidase [Mesorhizobium denitrificans]